MLRLTLAALVLLAAPLAQAQRSPLIRPYVRASAGGGVLKNVLDYGVAEVEQNAYGVGASIEAGVTDGDLSLGLETTVARSRMGSAADLDQTLPTSDYADAWQTSAVVVGRRQFEAGPLTLSFGTGVGVGYGSTVVQSSPAVRRFVDGRLVGPLDTRRESAVTALFHIDAAAGRQFGDTFVGLSAAADRVPFSGETSRYGSARLGVTASRTF